MYVMHATQLRRDQTRRPRSLSSIEANFARETPGPGRWLYACIATELTKVLVGLKKQSNNRSARTNPT